MMSNDELLDLVNVFIDDRIDAFGLYNTIAYLLDQDVTPEDLVKVFRFDETAVDQVVKVYNDPNKDPYDEFFGL